MGKNGQNSYIESKNPIPDSIRLQIEMTVIAKYFCCHLPVIGFTKDPPWFHSSAYKNCFAIWSDGKVGRLAFFFFFDISTFGHEEKRFETLKTKKINPFRHTHQEKVFSKYKADDFENKIKWMVDTYDKKIECCVNGESKTFRFKLSKPKFAFMFDGSSKITIDDCCII